jgi:hypothetical protein
MEKLKNSQKNNNVASKDVLAGVILILFTFCATIIWIAYAQKQAQTDLEQQQVRLQEESEQFHKQINEAHSLYLVEANRVNTGPQNPLDPNYLVSQLYEIDNSTDEYKRNSLTFYSLYGLLKNGTNALSAIKDLIINQHNFDLNIKMLYSPRTLRQEIMTLLVSMNTQPAADLLSQLLPATQDAKEMRNLCEALLSISDGYRPYCIQAARTMYERLTKESNVNKSEINSLRSILIQLLQDREFAINLMEQRNWLESYGNIDENLFAISYKTLQDDIIPYCYEAALYQVEHRKYPKSIDRTILDIAKEYITHPQSPEILLMGMTNATSPLIRSYECIMGLSLDKNFYRDLWGYWGFYSLIDREDTESGAVDPEIIQKANERLLFLDNITTQFADNKQITQLIEIVRSSLKHTANTDPNKGEWNADQPTIDFIKNTAMQMIDENSAINHHMLE